MIDPQGNIHQFRIVKKKQRTYTFTITKTQWGNLTISCFCLHQNMCFLPFRHQAITGQ